ncbi:hypothetical protein AB7C87_08755 [Natrarchaeobius sp. A-rgal3]|uniref:hypothetical protein n=1 Tax=Natrarchaeobius versutus TaxID=1679078 RepID=UPI00350FD3E8
MASSVQPVSFARQHLKDGVFVAFVLGFLALSVPAFAEPMTFWTGIVFGGYGYPTHELHHFVLGSVFTVLLLGVIGQAIRPSRRVGALHSSVLIWLSLTVVFAITGDFSPVHLVLLALLLGAVLTHPAGASQRPDAKALQPAMVAVGVLTAVGAIAFAGLELHAHLAVSDDHTALGHYQFMATTGTSIAALSLYGCLRGPGWRFPVYAGAALLSVIGLASIAYPGAEQGSSLGVGLGIVVVGWAVLFVLVAERNDALSKWFGR